jgi:putative ABC transport system ATP-binding protein
MLKLVDVNVRDTLRDLCLSVDRGEFVVVIGANGAGKTTLFNAISGRVKIKSGAIILGDSDITNLPQHKRATVIATVLQDPLSGTIGEMTLLENLSIAYIRCGRKKISKDTVDYFREKLSVLKIGLENRLGEYAKNLSGGQRQLLSLVMATSADYQLLLLDEITAALDPKSSDIVIEMTERIVSMEKKTCILITHNKEYMHNIGDRTLEMADGKLKDIART